MNVYIMNLKDKRTGAVPEDSKNKFKMCLERGILAIGWVEEQSKLSEQKAYSSAKNAIKSFKKDDLVWVRNPYAEEGETERYICKVLSDDIQTATCNELNDCDIGEFQIAEFYPVDNIPAGINAWELVSRHTIQSANENVTNKTIEYFNTLSSSPKKENKFKKILISIGIVIALALSVFGGTKVYKLINIKTHPPLPEGMTMGMSIDDFQKFGYGSTPESYRPEKNDYCLFPDERKPKVYKKFCKKVLRDKLYEKIESKNLFIIPNIEFNSDKELYSIGFIAPIKEYFGDLEFSELMSEAMKQIEKYYSKSTGKKPKKITEDINAIRFTFEDDNTSYYFSWTDTLLCIEIKSTVYAPQYPEISSEEINDSFDEIYYENCNLQDLINLCVSNPDITYEAYRDVYPSLGPLIDTARKSGFSNCLSTSYLITVHGDIRSNPHSKYLAAKDVDVLKLLMIFDDKGEFIYPYFLEVHDDFETFARLYY